MNPTTPQYAAGRPTDATVCVPVAAAHMRAPTAAADPLLDPPGVCSRLHGLQVGPGSKVANSVVTVLPKMTAPSRRSRATHSASNPGVNVWRKREPAVVRRSLV